MKKKNIKPVIRKPRRKAKEFSILFVCSGNTCRSPMAKGLMDKIIQDNLKKSLASLNITTLSAGTIATNGQLPTDYAQQAVRKYGADINHHLSAPLTKERIKMAKLILGMQEKHKIAVLELVPTAISKTFIITEYINQDTQGIADPIGQPLSIYQKTADKLFLILQKVYNKIIQKK